MRGEYMGRRALTLFAAAGILAAAAMAETALADPLFPFDPDPFPSTYAPLPREDRVITNVTILDGAGGRIEKGAVLMRDGQIVAVGADLDLPPDALVVDGEGRWVTPGIIDVHSHLGNAPLPITPLELKSWDVNERTDPNTAHVWAEHAIFAQDPAFSRAIASGVTTLQILPGSTNLFGGRGVVIKNVPTVTVQERKFPGAPVALKMACGENPKYNYGLRGMAPGSRMGVVAGMRQALQSAQEYLAKWDEYRKELAEGDDDPAPTRDFKLETLALALKGEILVNVHCYRADDMAMVIDLAEEFGLRLTAFHHAIEAYKIAPMLAEKGICAAVWSDWWGFKMEGIDGIRENAPFVDAAGGCVAMHSDSPLIGQRLNLETAKAVGAGRRAGLEIPSEKAIQWVTLNAARIIGLEDKIGTLEPGKNADLVLWSGDPFSSYTRADQVYIDGALVYDRADPERQPGSDMELGQPAVEVR